MKNIQLIFICLGLFAGYESFAQGCCSGGGNNPLAGGAASGVLTKGEVELALSNVFSNSNQFFTGNEPSTPFFEKLNSNYLFLRSDVGITEKLTFSAAVGYYTNRTIYEFKDTLEDKQKLVSSKGIGDLILLPRYQIFNRQKNGLTRELDLGLGIKLPLGRPDDSTFVGQSFFINNNDGQPFLDSTEIWQTSPPLVQTTTGSNDFMAYLFYMHNKRNLNFYLSGMYILRGWNSLGIKFGDFASIGAFFGKRFSPKFSVVGQIRGEWTGKMKTHDKIDYLANYNIDVTSTGSSALFFSPQLNYSYKEIRFFMLADIPLYQDLNGTQVALPRQITAGIAYRFFPDIKNRICEPSSSD